MLIDQEWKGQKVKNILIDLIRNQKEKKRDKEWKVIKRERKEERW